LTVLARLGGIFTRQSRGILINNRRELSVLVLFLYLALSNNSVWGAVTLCGCSAFSLTDIGQVSTVASEVIDGSASVKGSYSGTGSYTPYMRTDPSRLLLAPGSTYRITFKYRILVTPNRGFETLFYSPTGGAAGNFLPSTTITGAAGASGTQTLTNTLGPYSDYEARWNIVGTGAISIDDIQIVNVTTGLTIATEDAEVLVIAPGSGASVFSVAPPSNLLPSGTKQLALSVQSTTPTTCRYVVNADPRLAAFKAFDTGAGTSLHQTIIRDLSPNPAVINQVYVRCDSNTAQLIELKYRSVATVSGNYPHIGSLWTSQASLDSNFSPASRFQLFLGADYSLQEITRLRAVNPNALLLTSVSADEASDAVAQAYGIPDSYFLRDVNGKRIEGSWALLYKLNLTKPEVADLLVDGIFFDNVRGSTSWLKTDAYGNPIHYDADGNGIEDDPVWLDAAWGQGVSRMLAKIQSLLPNALLAGHIRNADLSNPLIKPFFNGQSIVTEAVNVREGSEPFSSLWNTYQSWFSGTRQPAITMIEGAPPNRIAYGYGTWNVSQSIPPATFEFARTFYPNMRFGLATALMNNGYFFHDFGDVHTIMADLKTVWWYDEYDFDLGTPMGEPQLAGATGFGGNTVDPVYRRDFTKGVVLLNGTDKPVRVKLEPGLLHFSGQQAPRTQFIIDDHDAAFTSQGGWRSAALDSDANSPGPKPVGPYYHSWNGSCRVSDDGAGVAQWKLNLTEDGEYTIQTWWPAAPGSNGWSKQVVYEVLIGGTTLATVILDQSMQGDQWHTIAKLQLKVSDQPFVRVHSAGIGAFVADAIHVFSTARLNDGATADEILINPMDGVLLKRLQPIAPGQITLSATPGGAVTRTTSDTGAVARAGYAVASTTAGSTPAAIAVFSVVQNGVVVSEAGVAGSPPTRSTRIFVDYRPVAPAGAGVLSINTGFAIANLGGAYASITLLLRDLDGRALASGTASLAPGAHIAKFISELQSVAADFRLPSSFAASNGFGSLEIVSSQPISITALRLTTNQRGETLLTSVPVADQEAAAVTKPLYFPQMADGGGFTTTIVLLNTSAAPESGTISIFDDAGRPLAIRPIGGALASTFSYSIPNGGTYVFQTDGSSQTTRTGWIQLTPNTGNISPAGAGIFSYSPNGILITESGVPAANPTTRARIYMDKSGGHDTGIAIANSLSSSNEITLQAFQSDGATPIGGGPVKLNLTSKGHVAEFVGEMISGLAAGITGVVEISSGAEFAALTLRSLANTRGDFLITTFPIADANQPAPTPIVFPQIAEGGGYATQFIFISPAAGASVTLNLIGDDGAPLTLDTN
jgi:hypothetical protein